jgi:hypothetical protein
MIFALINGLPILGALLGRLSFKLLVGLAIVPFVPFPFNIPVMMLA